MIFIYISLFITLFDLILWMLNASKAAHMFKSRYPDLAIPTSHWSDKAINYIKGGFMILCPIMNIAMGWVFLFNSAELCEKTVEHLYEEAMAAKLAAEVSEIENKTTEEGIELC